MSILTPGGLPECDRLGNALLPSFRNMIRLEDVFYDEELSGGQKILFALELLYGPESMPEDMEAAVGELVWFYHCGEEPDGKSAAKAASSERAYDFEEDAAYIYAGFRSAYGIDLADEDLFLHWWEFMALFISLPEDTKMAQRMFYRTVDTKGMGKEQRRHYAELKKTVALKSRRGGMAAVGNTLQDKIDARQRQQRTRVN